MERTASAASISSPDYKPAILVSSNRVSLDIGYGSPTDGDDIELRMKSGDVFTVPELAMQRPLPPSNSTIFTRPVATASETSAPHGNQSDTNRNTSELAPVDGGFGAWSFVRASASGRRPLLKGHS
jgi:hypothetical protein